MDYLSQARQYQNQHQATASNRYRPLFHLSPLSGWMNDPNGFIQFSGNFHMFYQHNPYATIWGPMHWGHAISDDLITWKHLPIALAPDQKYDREFGCFSGSAIEKDGQLFVMYTGVNNGQQTQNIAQMDKSGELIKYEHNPVIGADQLPEGYSIADFRDPKVFVRQEIYYVVIGAKKVHANSSILLYSSKDLLSWKYIGIVYSCPSQNGNMLECPDLIQMGTKDVLLLSSQFANSQVPGENQNVHSVIYLVGELNLQTGILEKCGPEQELDSGFDFYAATTTKTPDGRIILSAWMNMWDRISAAAQEGWVGNLTLPRELTLIEGKIYQTPVPELDNYRRNPIMKSNIEIKKETQVPGVEGNHIDLEFTIDVRGLSRHGRAGIRFLQGTKNDTSLYYDKKHHWIVFDRSRSGMAITDKDTKASDVRHCLVRDPLDLLRVRIVMDCSCVEIFINGGAHTMSGLVYPDETDRKISFFCEKGRAQITYLKKYDLVKE